MTPLVYDFRHLPFPEAVAAAFDVIRAALEGEDMTETDPTIADEPEAPTDDQPEPENDPVVEPDDGAGEAAAGVEP